MKRFFFLPAFSLVISCNPDLTEVTPENNDRLLTENVIVVIIDGPRMSETWGDQSRKYIPRQTELSNQGVFFNNFYNEGETFTLSGHAAITTGHYEIVTNNGSEFPSNPSIFQYFLQQSGLPPQKACLITSKGKLAALNNTKSIDWRGSYLPNMNAKDRTDQETFMTALEILEEDKPKLTLIHFKGPDSYGHGKDWSGYLKSIQETDEYVGELWKFLQQNEFYQGNTSLLVTNDHGRHLDGLGSGFVGHGDRCQGCQHISLLAMGPDFSPGIVDKKYGQTDIAPTIASLLGFKWQGEGETIDELIK